MELCFTLDSLKSSSHSSMGCFSVFQLCSLVFLSIWHGQMARPKKREQRAASGHGLNPRFAVWVSSGTAGLHKLVGYWPSQTDWRSCSRLHCRVTLKRGCCSRCCSPAVLPLPLDPHSTFLLWHVTAAARTAALVSKLMTTDMTWANLVCWSLEGIF